MLKPSRTWPNILQKTMAVVQLRFDGKYAYSTIANINQSQKSQIIENQLSITSERQIEFDDNKQDITECMCEHSKDSDEKCRSFALNGCSTTSTSASSITCNGKAYNGHLCHPHMNGHSLNSATSSPTIKVCLCSYHNNNNSINNNLTYNNNRQRSESIKVENWDYIYRERPYLDVPHSSDRSAVPKSPQNGFGCDHGYLSGRGAQKLDTIFRHYYPESGFGWIILIVAVIVAIITHGFQLSAVLFLLPAVGRFNADNIECLGWLGALSTAVALFISPLTIGVCKRKSTRITAVIGGLVTALGCLFTSFASQFHQMFFSYGTVVGIGVGMCRDCSTLMIAQYFKRKREFVEIFIVSGSGAGIALMSTFIKSAIDGVGWRLGLQAVTICVFSTFILGTCYRSASLYHPQRRAILHLKNQKRKIKDKTKQFESPPFFDFSTLKSKTVRILLLSSAITAFGINTPLFYLAHQITLDGLTDEVLMLQVYLGCSWVLGCVIFGLLVVKNSVECRIARQYLCQTAMFMCGLTMLSLTTIRGNYHAYLLFVWIYGIFLGGYHYSLKMFTFEKVRARNFARAWGFVQFSQALPIALGVPLTGYLNLNYPGQVGYYVCAGCSIVGSLTLFLVDVHKRNVRLHKEKSTKENGSHTCSQTCQKRKLSFDNEQDHEPALQGTAALILGTEILVPHINDVIMNAVNGIEKPELTCISEEGIADMDYLPENLLDEFDFNNLEENDDDDITSCNKIKYSLSEMENNGIGIGDGKKLKRGATIRNNNKNFLSLTAQVIPELSHESQDEEKSILINGHHVNCNVNKHLRNNSEQPFTAPAFPVANNRVISVIEEAAV